MLTVLVVGNGATARSIASVGLLRSALADNAAMVAVEIGALSPAGVGIDPRLRVALEKSGLELELLPPVPERAVRTVDVQLADLVITMDRQGRARMTELAPESIRRIFCLREFADLARVSWSTSHPPGSHTPGGRLAIVVDEAADARGIAHPPRSPDDDAVPTYDGSPWRRRATTRVIRDAVRRTADVLSSALVADRP